jgi:hypothetical protein
MSSLQDKYKSWKEHCRNIQEMNPIDPHELVRIQNMRKQAALSDFRSFCNSYFKHYVTAPAASFHVETANKILKDDNIFAILEWPREHAKSVVADIFIPIWLMIHGELSGMILVGKNEDDANGLLSDVQAELQYNPLLIHDFGPFYQAGDWADGNFTTAGGIEFIAIGRGQSPRGIRNREKRPNYCVVDDIDDDEIVQNRDRVERTVDYLLGSLYPALDTKKSRFVMVGNRIHRYSILAHIVGDTDPDQPKRKGIFHSKICAIQNGLPAWPENYTLEQLQKKFDRMGYYLSQREYFHNPVTKGKLFKAEWITWGKIPPLREMDMIVCYFDPSYKPKTTNDFKAVRMWGAKGIKRYLIKSFVRQTTITTAVKWMYDLYEQTRDKCSVIFYMEEVFLQGMFFDDFDAEARLRGYYLPIHGDQRSKPDKFVRIQATAAYYERGVCIYNESERKSPDMQAGLDQVLGFQKGASIHDDAPDADEGALFILNKYNRQIQSPPIIGMRKNTKGW